MASIATQFFMLRWWGKVSDKHGNRLVMLLCSAAIPVVSLLWLFGIFAIAQAYSHAKGVPILLSGCTENTGYRCYKFQPTGAYIEITGQYHHLKGSGPSTAKIFIDEDPAWNGPGYQALFGDVDAGEFDPHANPIWIHEGVEFRGRWRHAFDAGVNSGISRGTRWVQEGLGVAADGVIGSKTFVAAE